MQRVYTLSLLFLFVALSTVNTLGQSIRYVKPTATGTGDGSSWANASANVQLMLNSSVFNDEVHMAQGLYLPTLDQDGNVNNGNPRRRTFTIPGGIRLRGGYAGTGANPNLRMTTPSSTTLSGDLGVAGNFSDNSYHVVTMPNAFSTVLDGVVITGGNANTVVSGYGTRDIYGGGILLLNLSNSLVTPVLFRVYVTDNQASNGGGIANFGGTLDGNTLVRVSNPQLTFCQIVNNRATRNGGGFFNTGNASPTFTNCVFQQNVATQSGGGISNETTSILSLTMSPVLTGCVFESNSATVSGGGIDNVISTNTIMDATIERSKFTNNFVSVSGSGRGGAVYNRTAGGPLTMLLRNSWFYSNAADQGGALFSITTSTTTNVGINLFNSTLTGNSARVGGAVYHQNTTNTALSDLYTLYLINTILWGNTATANIGGVAAYGYIPPQANFNDIQGCSGQSWCGAGLRNTDANPLLNADNLTPSASSPILNLGNPFSTTQDAGTADISGFPRIQGGQIDLGAVESNIVQTTINSFTNGTWSDPNVWDCFCIPKVEQVVVMQHDVQIPANYVANTRKIQYVAPGKLRFATPNARLSMTPGVSF
jgi:predicted outer membrane repeat protein